MSTVFSSERSRTIVERLSEAHRQLAAAYPGEPAERQPVHTVYGGAHLFRADIARKLGDAALGTLEEFAPDAATFARALGLPGPLRRASRSTTTRAIRGARRSVAASRGSMPPTTLAETVYARVMEKLRSEPVEDYRIDFEDGYGNRPDSEEDNHAAAAAAEMARGMTELTLPPFVGIRIKPLTGELHARSLKTLDLFLTTLVERSDGVIPPHFVVTLPKVTSSDQVTALVDALEQIEEAIGLFPGTLKLELMIETPQSIIGPRGEIAVPLLVAAARGRCRGAHFGTYDYTAACNIIALYQVPSHPACDFARHVLQVSLAGTGVTISDGATMVMPVPRHRAEPGGRLTAAQKRENLQAVHRGWKIHYDDVRSSLRHAYYQGWDLSPAQLPTRYAAVFAFFLERRDEAAARLQAFVERAAQATLLGSVFDDAATGQGLLNFFLRGMNCGALTEAEALATGLTLEELRSRSFVKILDARRGRTE